MTETQRIKVDWIAGVIMALFVVIQGSAMRLADIYSRSDAVSGGSGASGGVSTAQETAWLSAGEILVIAAVEITLILLLWRGFKRLPARWRRRIRVGFMFTVAAMLYFLGLLIAWPLDLALAYVVGVPLAYVSVRYLKAMLSSQGLKWLAFNIIAVSLGTVVVFLGGVNLSPRLVIVIMVAFMIYDHYAVHLSTVMSEFVELSSKTKFPNFLVVPTQLRVDLAELHEYIQGERDEKPDEIAVIIGLGDFIFPSVLIVSVFVAAEATVTVPLVTAVAGLLVSVVVLRASLDRADGGLPALPYLNTGTIGGYVLGVAVVAAV